MQPRGWSPDDLGANLMRRACEADRVGSLITIAVLVVVGVALTAVFRARRRSLVPKRGFGVAADMGGLADAPQVQIRSVDRTGPDRIHVVFTPEEGTDLEFDVSLADDDFGSELLDEWHRDRSTLAMVIPPQSRLIRLRAIESLQHLTLRRADPT